MKYWEIIADKLSACGWSWGCVSTVNSNGQTIFVADAHRDNGKRFIVTADEKLTAFLEFDRVTHESFPLPKCRMIRHNSPILATRGTEHYPA